MGQETKDAPKSRKIRAKEKKKKRDKTRIAIANEETTVRRGVWQQGHSGRHRTKMLSIYGGVLHEYWCKGETIRNNNSWCFYIAANKDVKQLKSCCEAEAYIEGCL